MKYFVLNQNKRMRELIKEIIINENDKVFEFENFYEALNSLLTHNPDFAFVDIQFKDRNLDGLEITKKLLEKKHDLKVIIISDFDSESFRVAAKNSGAFEFVPMDNLISLKSKLNSLIAQ